jgi:hypothetical protein
VLSDGWIFELPSVTSYNCSEWFDVGRIGGLHKLRSMEIYLIEFGRPAFAPDFDDALCLEDDVSYLPRIVVFILEVYIFALTRPFILRYHLFILTKELNAFLKQENYNLLFYMDIRKS